MTPCAWQNPRVLKVFSLPEFFFRGPLGAYSLQDTLGDAYHTNSFISQLQELLAGDRWSHWLGIFGTLIAYQIAPGPRYRLHNVRAAAGQAPFPLGRLTPCIAGLCSLVLFIDALQFFSF